MKDKKFTWRDGNLVFVDREGKIEKQKEKAIQQTYQIYRVSQE